MAERERVTVLQAAEALRVSDDTIRRGLAGKGPLAELLRDAGRRDNTGRWTIELTAAEVERHRSPLPRIRQPTLPEVPHVPLADADLVSLRDLADTLRVSAEAAAAAHAAELDRLRADIEHERAERRAERQAATAERDAAATDIARERDRAEGALIRAAASEAEVKGLREALEEARRPFWRRWLG
jgi:hypothetical protein